MKTIQKNSLLLLLFFISISAFSQELPNLKHIKLNKKSHFKGTEAITLKVVNYLFATPINKKNKSRNEAAEFLVKWMDGTPDYIFYLEEKETNFFNTDADFMVMYMAALTKFTLEHPQEKDKQLLAIGAMNLALPYLYAQPDKKNWSKELWQLNDAYKNANLAAYLYP